MFNMSSDGETTDLMASFKKGAIRAPRQRDQRQSSFSPGNFISGESSGDAGWHSQRSRPITRKAVAVRASPVRDRSQYVYFDPQNNVERISRKYQESGNSMYEIKLSTGQTKQVSDTHLWRSAGVRTAGEPVRESEVKVSLIREALSFIKLLRDTPTGLLLLCPPQLFNISPFSNSKPIGHL